MEYSDELLKQFMPMIHKIANKFDTRFDSSYKDDLVEVGKEALIKAVKKFDEKRGAKFSTYLHNKVENAMVDELRKSSWFKRSGNRQFQMVSFSDHKLLEENDLVANPEEIIESREKTSLLKEAIKFLPKQHAKVIKLMYWNGMNMIEVASYLRMSEGRISQLHKEAIQLMGEKVNK